jgi:hypothetical protein
VHARHGLGHLPALLEVLVVLIPHALCAHNAGRERSARARQASSSIDAPSRQQRTLVEDLDERIDLEELGCARRTIAIVSNNQQQSTTYMKRQAKLGRRGRYPPRGCP